MAIYNETWTADDEMDYDITSTAAVGITRADARKGLAARISAEQANAAGRPKAEKTGAVSQKVIGAITHVGRKGCKVVKGGRFVLQAASAYVTSDFGKQVISVAAGTNNVNVGKVEAHTTDFAEKGDLAIVGGGNDTSTDGIGHYYLVECL